MHYTLYIFSDKYLENDIWIVEVLGDESDFVHKT